VKRLLVLVRSFVWLAGLATLVAPVSPVGHWHAAVSPCWFNSFLTLVHAREIIEDSRRILRSSSQDWS